MASRRAQPAPALAAPKLSAGCAAQPDACPDAHPGVGSSKEEEQGNELASSAGHKAEASGSSADSLLGLSTEDEQQVEVQVEIAAADEERKAHRRRWV